MAIPRTIRIGYVGEKMYRHQDIDISDLLVDYPTAVATLYHKRASDDDGYPVVTEMVDSHTLRWTFSDVDSAEKGYGEAVIVMATSDGAHIGRSHVIETVTGRSIVTDEDVPEAYTPYINQVSALKAQMKTISDHIDSVAQQIDVDTIKAEIDTAKTTAVNAVSAQGTTSKTAVANQGTASKAEVTAQATKAKGEINTLTSGFSATVAAGVASVQYAQTTAQTAIDTKRASFETYATSQFEDIATKTAEAKSAKDDSVSAKNEAVSAKVQAVNAVESVNKVNFAVSKTGNTATITATDKTGAVTTATVTDGTNGRDGRDGTDASVTADNIKSALGVDVVQAIENAESEIDALDAGKADAEHTHSYNDLTDKPTIPSSGDDAKYELIDEYTVTSDVSIVSRSGANYNLKKCIVYISAVLTASSRTVVTRFIIDGTDNSIVDGNTLYYDVSPASVSGNAGTKNLLTSMCDVSTGIALFECLGTTNSTYFNNATNAKKLISNAITGEKITGILLWVSGANMSPGTKIKVYGVKANAD